MSNNYQGPARLSFTYNQPKNSSVGRTNQHMAQTVTGNLRDKETGAAF